jgi:hypothetical protein
VSLKIFGPCHKATTAEAQENGPIAGNRDMAKVTHSRKTPKFPVALSVFVCEFAQMYGECAQL